METAPLKTFATWARTALIGEVSARITTVLAPASIERVEQANTVTALEKAIATSGGGAAGRAAVADRVAYTWFNRIIALRFMDANGYTGTGVVSPQYGVAAGQPEILADAKRGTFDSTVVGARSQESVLGLLNGTRRSDDPQGEAYALLLADCCRHWNRAMPFMFEREGEFTELLIPANLLADDSVLTRAVEVLSTEVCQDVEVIGWLYQFYIAERKDEVFAGFKKNKKAGAAEIPAATQLFTPHWIVRYLVENSLGRLWMLNRPTSRLTDQMDYYIAPADEETDFLKISSPEEIKVIDPACGSGHMLTYAFDLLYAIYEEEGYAPSEIPGLILAINLYGTEIDPRAGALAAFALTMKARARQRTFFTKHINPRVCALQPTKFTYDEIDFLLTDSDEREAETTFWNQFEHADVFGSLIQPDPELTARLGEHVAGLRDDGDLFKTNVIADAERVVLQAEYLSPRYLVAVANPPYMGSSNMSSQLASFLKERYELGKSDLFASFVLRGFELVAHGGFSAMVVMQSWMFLSSYEKFRAELLKARTIECLAHLGNGVMGIAFGTSAVVWRTSHNPRTQAAYHQYEVSDIMESRPRNPPSRLAPIRRSGKEMESIPGIPLVYYASDQELALLSKGLRVGDLLDTREGLTTGDNDKFLRRWYEVSACKIGWHARHSREGPAGRSRWFLYVKGGEVRRWFGNLDYVVDWEDDGKRQRGNVDARTGRVRSHNYNGEYAFREGLTWSGLTNSEFSVRYVPAGHMFDAKGPMGFAKEPEDLLFLLGLLNSGTIGRVIALLAPTMDFKLGHVLKLPVRGGREFRKEISSLAGECVTLSRVDWNAGETAYGFDSTLGGAGFDRVQDLCEHTVRAVEKRKERLNALQMEIDRIVAQEYGLPTAQGLSEVELQGSSPMRTDSTLASSWCATFARELVAYAVGCMFGRYSLDESGLILADEGATLQDFLAKVPTPTFTPDADNVIPIVDGDWFEDDIVARFREFLRTSFGEQHFEENLRFVTESLGVKSLRDYFVKSFYKDHVQRYKKRPIYWLFSSPNGSFNALIYMHRYTPSTVSTVLNEYLREYGAKLAASLVQQERLAAGGGTPRLWGAAQKEVDRLRKVLLELEEYERDVLYPLASRQLSIDLDDGVKANYPKFGAALKKVPGLEGSDG